MRRVAACDRCTRGRGLGPQPVLLFVEASGSPRPGLPGAQLSPGGFGSPRAVSRSAAWGSAICAPVSLDADMEVVSQAGQPPGAGQQPGRQPGDRSARPAHRTDYLALARAMRDEGIGFVLDELEVSSLQGRAEVPASRRMSSGAAVCAQAELERYVVCNADEGEPGTFKDRDVMLHQPHRVDRGVGDRGADDRCARTSTSTSAESFARSADALEAALEQAA